MHKMIRHTAAFAALLAISTSILANNDATPILLYAKLDTKQVMHKLMDSKQDNKAGPFYKAFCKNVKSHDYKNAEGLAILQFYPKTNTVKFALTYQGLSGPAIMSHFHLGDMKKAGPIVQTICGHPPPGSKALGFSSAATSGKQCPMGTAGFLTGTYKLEGNPKLTPALSADQERKDLLSGKLYFNVHTCLNEAGEIRGQVLPYRK